MAVISQDARHLEVRDALPSPLGFIVVPAEAANRIVNQLPDDPPSRLSSQNTGSLTSFLASFLLGPSTIYIRGDTTAPTSSTGITASDDFGSSSLVDWSGASAGVASAGNVPSSSALSNSITENASSKPIPAVNIVFLVDTLRLCRFAEAGSPLGTLQQPGQKSGSHRRGQVVKRDQRPLGLTDTAAPRAEVRPPFEGSDDRHKTVVDAKHSPQAPEDRQLESGVSHLADESGCGRRCMCTTSDACNLRQSSAPVLHSQFADVLLLCADGVEISSHRALLAARCSFFEAKLTRSHWEAHQSGKVSLPWARALVPYVAVISQKRYGWVNICEFRGRERVCTGGRSLLR